MPATVILGGHWGDEGKGKVIDLLADRFGYNVRYSGGANAGHTVVNERGKFALHQVPSGIFHDGVVTMLSAGVVVDPEALLREMVELEERGVELNRFHLSERAHLVLPYHRVLDVQAERCRSEGQLGTTGKGIGPAYADKAARDGLRVGDMLDPDTFTTLLRRGVEAANVKLTCLYDADPLDSLDLLDRSREWAAQLAPRICDVERELRSALQGGRSILLEGAQGALLDLDHGSYPYVTSSSTGAAGACASAGLPPTSVESVVAVLHSYMTRVGAGPFPTELHDETGERIRTAGNEFGTTTGRPRRCGWFDVVASRYVMELNDVSSVALTKLDVLDGLETVKVCVGYRVNGREIEHFPSRAADLSKAEPVYEELRGWSDTISEARTWEELPPQAQQYVHRIGELLQAPVSIVSVGPARAQTVILSDPLGQQ